ncbi:MAG: S8 family serine peptidase [Acidimicrobiales bacterium]
MVARTNSTRRFSRWLLVFVVFGLLSSLSVGASVAAPSTPGAARAPHGAVIVIGPAGTDLASVITAAGGTVDRVMPSVGAVAATLSPVAAATLSREPGVQITPDRLVRLASKKTAVASFSTMAHVADVVDAPQAWKKGATGAGIDVALIDSGIAEVDALAGPGRVLHGPDLSFDSQTPDRAFVDGFGHGTHMAGIIAGSAIQEDGFTGIAPSSRLVSVKVADANGAADVSQVIAAIDWVVQHRRSNGLNIRVLNLSFGTGSDQSYRIDPLAHAAEVAWRNGIVVVTSAGNDGEHRVGLTNPAYNPYVLAVAAVDTGGTMKASDDVVPNFSSRGDGTRNPDVAAPGVSLASLRAPGSAIDEAFPSARTGTDYFRGTGTSQAAAVTSGAAAALLSAYPAATPDDVKAALSSSASRLRGVGPEAQGSGMIDVDKALKSLEKRKADGPPQKWAPSEGTGSLEAARGGTHLVDANTGTALRGEVDIFGRPFDSVRWSTAAAAGESWADGVWNGTEMAGTDWDSVRWSSVRWSSVRWSATNWAGTDWDSVRWSSVRWSSVRWSCEQWSSVRWASSGWASVRWN